LSPFGPPLKINEAQKIKSTKQRNRIDWNLKNDIPKIIVPTLFPKTQLISSAGEKSQ
jgi:hypothetical protein